MRIPVTFRPMSDARTRLYFDFVDPGSYLMELRLQQLTAGQGRTVERVPFELRLPEEPMLDAGDEGWERYWGEMAAELAAEGVSVVRPVLVPWTRKAHELTLLAAESGHQDEARQRVFERYQIDGQDIGRVDVLLEIAAELGLDRSAAKAVLDVDRLADAVAALRGDALEKGVRGVPTLVRNGDFLEGVHDRTTIATFVEGSA